MAADVRLGKGRLSLRLTVCIAAPTALALALGWTAWNGFSGVRDGALIASSAGVSALPSAVRLMQAADGLGAAANRLLWAEGFAGRSSARAAADVHRGVIADHLSARPDVAKTAIGRQIADGLELFDRLLGEADQQAERRLEALANLPAARERLVMALAGLDGLLVERRGELNALLRFHPDTQNELERHDEWRRVSKNLLGALLLTANAGDGQSGAATAHLARLTHIIEAFPESSFAQLARRQQDGVVAAMTGPLGALTRLAALREAREESLRLEVDMRRASMDLAQAATDYIEAVRVGVDKRLTDMAAHAVNQQRETAIIACVAALVAGVGAAYAAHAVGGRLRRLLRAMRDGDRLDAAARGDDEITAFAVAAQSLLDDVKRREKAVEDAAIRFDLAIEAADSAVWDEDLREGRVWWSPAYYRLLGYAPGEIVPAMGAWEMLVHPDDRAAAAEAAERCVAGLSDHYAATYRMRRKDGEWLWVEDNGGVQRDQDGLAARFAGLMRDVSQRRRAEMNLRRAKEAAEATARASSDLLMTADRRLRPNVRRLTTKLAELESWALTDEQRRLVADVKRDGQEFLEALATLSRSSAGGKQGEPG